MTYFDTSDYGYFYEPTPTPPLDTNWVDPRLEVRNYLKRIQPDYIQEDFKGLKETALYLLEVLIDTLELRKDQIQMPVEVKQLKTKIKFPTLGFVDLDEGVSTNNVDSVHTYKPYTDLFENIFTSHRHYDNQKLERDNLGDEDSEELTAPEPNDPENNMESKGQSTDGTTLHINAGKAALLVMSGLEMVQSLQRHPITVLVRQAAVTMQAEARLPESFRQAVLNASRPEVVLPVSAVTSDSNPLWAEDGSQTGVVKLTLTLSCLGCAVVKPLRGVGQETHDCDKPMFLKTVKSKPQDPEHSTAPKQISRSWKVNFKTTKEILRSCYDGTTSRDHVLENCCWVKMARASLAEDHCSERRPLEGCCTELLRVRQT